ncbi:MAG: ATP synthase F0 subunit B [Myxococcota bacterium]|jgi:F-type H+-transporting ATPase subunit b
MIDLDYTVLFQVAIFLIMMAFLNKLLFKPYLKLFDEREHLVAGIKEGAVELERAFQDKSARFDQFVREATSRAAAAMEKLKAEGQVVSREMVAKARARSSSEVEKALVTVNAEAATVRTNMSKDINLIAVQIAEKVLGRKIA